MALRAAAFLRGDGGGDVLMQEDGLLEKGEGSGGRRVTLIVREIGAQMSLEDTKIKWLG